jgi:octaprenyl-diphosphate synthase
MTLPVILTLAEANPQEREIITALLGNAEASDGQLAQVVAIFNRYESLNRTLARAQRHVGAARRALEVLPSSAMRTLLADIAEFTVARAY